MRAGVDAVRQEFQKIGLTDGEISLLKEISGSSERELDSFRKHVVSPALTQARERRSKSATRTLDSGTSAALADIQVRDRKITESHMEKLKIGLGPVRYKKLYDYVAGTMGPKIHTVSDDEILRGTRQPVKGKNQ
jgi:hypothetical protein